MADTDRWHYLLLGTDTQHVRFEERSVRVAAALANELDTGTRAGLADIATLALQVRTLGAAATSSTSTSTSTSTSPTTTAFNACLGSTVSQFHSALSNLFADLREKVSVNNTISESIIIADIRLALNDWFTIINHVYHLHLRHKSTPLIQYLSLLYTYSLVGDPLIAETSQSYFQSTAAPYLTSVKQWLLLGEDEDLRAAPSNDIFFIKCHQNYNFTFEPANIPSFIPDDDAEAIYHTGKALNFMKRYLNDLQWCNDFYSTHASLPFFKLDISSLYETTISRLNDLILHSYNVEISLLHNFLLFKQGDLIQSLIVNGYERMKSSPQSLSSHQLIALLQDSIESTSIVHNYPPSEYNRLDARLLNLNVSTTMDWELFTLDFKTLPPINAIIESQYKEYLRVFNFVFKLVQIKYKLDKVWKNSYTFGPSTTSIKGSLGSRSIRHYQRKLHLITHQFSSFVSTIIAYITNELLASQYTSFRETFSPKPYNLTKDGMLYPLFPKQQRQQQQQSHPIFTLDTLAHHHDEYIRSISRSALFYNTDKDKVPLNQVLYDLLMTIDAFTSLATEFQSSLTDLQQLEQLQEQGANTTGATSDVQRYRTLLLAKLKKIHAAIGTGIVEGFERNMTLFINLLSDSTEESLRCLAHIIEV